MVAEARITDVLARTRTLVERGVSTEQIVTQLRGEGFSLVESTAGLMRAGGMTGTEARDAVVDSPTWADLRETVESHRWIEPRNLPQKARSNDCALPAMPILGSSRRGLQAVA